MSKLPAYASHSVTPLLKEVFQAEIGFARHIVGPGRFHTFARDFAYTFSRRFYLMEDDVTEFLNWVHGGGETKDIHLWAENPMTKRMAAITKRIDQLQFVCAKKPFTVSRTVDYTQRRASIIIPEVFRAVLRVLAELGQEISVIELPENGMVVFPYETPKSTGVFTLNIAQLFYPVLRYHAVKRIEIRPGFLSENTFIGFYREEDSTMILQSAVRAEVPHDIKRMFFKKYPTRILITEIERRLAAGIKPVTAPIAEGSYTDRFTLGSGRYKAAAELKRLNVWQHRHQVYEAACTMIQTRVNVLIDRMAESGELLLESTHRRFWFAHNNYMSTRKSFWECIRAYCYKNTMPKVPALMPPDCSCWPKQKQIGPRDKERHNRLREGLTSDYQKMLMELANYKLVVGADPDCAFKMVSPVTEAVIKFNKPNDG